MVTLWLLFACTDDTTPPTGDSGPADSGTTLGTTTDEPELGLGELSGDCGVLDDEWTSSEPFTLRNAVELAGWDEALLSDQGTVVWEAGNLGGSSLESEVLAFEVLHACEGAALLKTEADISYDDSGGKKTDLLVEIDGHTVGVSVTRAFHYPPDEPYTLAEAEDLLLDKLADVALSADNASDADAWSRSVLHVVAYDGQYGDQITAAWAGLDSGVKGDHGVVLTVTDGDDEAIY